MNYLPLIAFAVIIILFVTYAGRARRKQQAVQAAMGERIGVGTEVMTTSGLYGTVVAKNPDGTVQLSIAAGVEVKWELAALRDVASLPTQFAGRPDATPRGSTDSTDGPSADDPSDPSGDPEGPATRAISVEKDDSGKRGEPR